MTYFNRNNSGIACIPTTWKWYIKPVKRISGIKIYDCIFIT